MIAALAVLSFVAVAELALIGWSLREFLGRLGRERREADAHLAEREREWSRERAALLAATNAPVHVPPAPGQAPPARRPARPANSEHAEIEQQHRDVAKALADVERLAAEESPVPA